MQFMFSCALMSFDLTSVKVPEFPACFLFSYLWYLSFMSTASIILSGNFAYSSHFVLFCFGLVQVILTDVVQD